MCANNSNHTSSSSANSGAC